MRRKRSREQRRSFKPIAKNILHARITSRKAQWNTEYTSARMPRMNRKVYTSSTSASGGESRVRSCWRRPTRLSASECGDLDPTFQGTTSDQYSKDRFRSRSRLSSEITSDLKHGTQSRQGPALSRTTAATGGRWWPEGKAPAQGPRI